MCESDSSIDKRACFDELKARANGMGWELHDKDDYQPWGYVLRPSDSDPVTVSLHTNSAVRLCPEDPKDPLCGLDSVSHMLDQIEFAQIRDLPRQGP
jgi:hypothetical protein